MPGPQIDEWKRAYDLLDAPYSASARDIKQAYRRITKRWHPDRYKTGTPAHDEATQMMKQINEAHALVADAPLRFFLQKIPAKQDPWSPKLTSAPIWRDPSTGRYRIIPSHSDGNVDLYCLAAFIIGACIGFMIAFALLGLAPARPAVLIFRSAGIITGFGYAFSWFQRRVGNLFIKR